MKLMFIFGRILWKFEIEFEFLGKNKKPRKCRAYRSVFGEVVVCHPADPIFGISFAENSGNF